jgi:hypothetical protein
MEPEWKLNGNLRYAIEKVKGERWAERLSSAAGKKRSFLAVRCNEGLEIAGIVKAKFSRPHNGHEAKPDQCASKELHR